MSEFLLLLPDALLICAGFVLCRFTALNRTLWDGIERLVYYLLFPVLLFISIVRAPIALAESADLLLGCLAVAGTGIAVAWLLRWLPRVEASFHASGAQVAFRFNSFIALAVANQLASDPGVALMALVVGVCVPVCNVAAVFFLAKHGGQSYGRELLRNPLIGATVCGLVGNVLGLSLPDVLDTTLQRVGQAALPLGLMAVGAGLTLQGLSASPGLAGGLLAVRHLVLPLVAWGVGWALALAPLERTVLMSFAALPTASSAYVLAARMGGRAAFVAGLVTASTVLGMLSLPLWLAWVR
ncbi:MAG: AEC family transporter [Pseudomonadota bacterium]